MIQLDDNIYKSILEIFPKNIPLMRGKIGNNKMKNINNITTSENKNFYMAIPEGDKGYVWFLLYKNEPYCVWYKSQENKMYTIDIKFHPSFTNGTILYGSCFYYEKSFFFTIEDIMLYKGRNVSNEKYIHTLRRMNDFFKHKKTEKNFYIGLPMMSSSLEKLNENIRDIPYKIQETVCIYYNYTYKLSYKTKNETDERSSIKEKVLQPQPTPSPKIKPENISSYKSFLPKSKTYKTFHIKADIQDDIYNLYVKDDSTDKMVFFDVAVIPDYVTSVMMNNIFRKIKENNDLDKLEESDDETEFEDDKEDKFVYLDKIIPFICTYNIKFNKWQPIRVANSYDL